MTSRQILGDPQLHFWLTRSVARVMGVSLSEAMANDQLSAHDYADLVTECRACSKVESCKAWLAEQLDVKPSAPPGCANSRPLETLARRH
jgi:hypothetical protein